MEYEIIPLELKNYEKCANIWDLAHPRAPVWYGQIEQGNRLVFVYTKNGEYLAEGAFLKDAEDEVYTIPGQRIYLSRLIVKPEERGRGIGRRMIEFMCAKAKEWGFSEVTLGVDLVNPRAMHLYESCGFTTVLMESVDDAGPYRKLLKKL